MNHSFNLRPKVTGFDDFVIMPMKIVKSGNKDLITGALLNAKPSTLDFTLNFFTADFTPNE